MIKSYRTLSRITTFIERFEYLKCNGSVGESTFGFHRYLNQALYTSGRWRKTRNNILVRDDGNDLGLDSYPISDRVIIHHINPITMHDIEMEADCIFDPDNLISTSSDAHRAIHYGDASLLPRDPIHRSKNDTCPWRV